jgi:DNA-directed RNA polymerase subunit beta'
VHLAEPASIIVSRAKLYPYNDEPIVVNGDRVIPGDELADGGKSRPTSRAGSRSTSCAVRCA